MTLSDSYTCFTLDVSNDVAHIRFTRPDLHNRFDEPAHGEFARVLAELVDRQVTKRDFAAVIISAEGRSFSAGGDMDMMLRANKSQPMRHRLMQEGIAIIEGLNALHVPVICALQGAAVGLGASVVACSDIVVGYREAQIADPHIVLGLVAGDGGIMGWSQSVGIMRAKRYLLTGEYINAEKAYEMGMVSDLVDTPEEVLPAAQAIADKIAKLPREGVRGTKRAFARLTRDLYGPAFELSLAYEMETLGGEELRDVVTTALAARDARKAAKK